MEIKRYKYPNENSYDYFLEQDNKTLSILYLLTFANIALSILSSVLLSNTLILACRLYK